MLIHRDENYSSKKAFQLSLTKAILSALAALYLSTFLPGAPKGIIIGHEFGNPKTELRLQLPIIRPILARRGDTITIRYWVRAPQGYFGLYERQAPMLLGLAALPKPVQIINMAMTTSGSSLYRVTENGYSFYTFAGRPISANTKACENRFIDFWDAMINKQSACPVFNGSYIVLLFHN